MTILASIVILDGTNSAASVSTPFVMESMVNLLSTPPSFWIVIILGIIASPWMIRPPAYSSIRRNTITYIASALFFIAAILLFILIRDRFISIFADLMRTPRFLFIFPFALGASPIGAALLVLSWYFVHPIPRLKEETGKGIHADFLAFTPMILTTVLLGAAMVISIFIRLL